MTDENGIFSYVNPIFTDLYGFAAEDIIGKVTPRILKSNHLNERDYKNLWSTILSNKNFKATIKNKKKDGTLVDIETSVNALLSEHGSITGFIAIQRDISERKRAEKKLLISETRYRRLFEAAKDGILILNANTGRIEDVNPFLVEMLGYTHTEFLNKELWEIGLFKDIVANKAAFQELQEQRYIRYDNLPLKTKDGNPIWVEFVSNTYDVHGKDVIQCNIRDITKRRNTEIELASKTAFLEAHMDSSLDGILVVDGGGRKILHNRRMIDLLKIPPQIFENKDDAVQVGFVTHQTKNPQEFMDKVIHLYSHPDEVSRDEIELIDGTILDRYSSPVRNKEGKHFGRTWTFRDITEFRASQDRVRRSEDRLQNILDNMRDVVFTVSPLGIFTSLSPAFQRITGWPYNDWIGRSFTSLIHPDDIPLVLDIFTRVLAGEMPWLYEVRIKTKEGPFITGEFLASPQKRDGKIIGVLGIGRDITLRKQADENKKILESQLVQAQKLESLGTLASGIAHDFNNILGIIVGYASLIEKLPANRANMEKCLTAIHTAGQRGANLVKQMLTFARKTEILYEPILINDIVNEVVKLLEETFPKTITLSVHLENDLPLIEADATQVHQVILNLCLNARDAMPHNGILTMTTRSESGEIVHRIYPKAMATKYIILSVTDTGSGMDEETQHRIFEPFFTTKGRGKGTGLGLALVFGILESHGGFVSLQSEVGKGTTFYCYFPVPQKIPVMKQIGDETIGEVPGGDETILLVEDEEMLRELVKQFLESKGYTVLLAGDGEEAITVFNQHENEIQLIISDLGLPKLGGNDLYEKLKMQNPDIVFILASGFIEPGIKADILKTGVKEFIPKPYNPNEVLRAIRRVLDGA